MIEQFDKDSIGSIMTIPKSMIFNTLKEAINTGDDNRISELAELLYCNMQTYTIYDTKIGVNSANIENQHQEVMKLIDNMKQGFIDTNKRFDEMNKSMSVRFEDMNKSMLERFKASDKRFDDLIGYSNKRFSLLTWLIGIGFVFINSLMVILKLFT